MRLYLQPELLANVNAPEQTVWDVPAMRAAGDLLQQSLTQASTPPDRITTTYGIELRIFIPSDPKVVLIAPHGGGYVAGKAAYDDARNTFLARHFKAIVISPEYRLAPEHPYPAGRDDVLATIEWAQCNYPGIPIFGYGDSAGSGLFYSAALAATPGTITGFICLEPCIDPTRSTRSIDTCADGPVWTKKANEYAWQAYGKDLTTLGTPDADFPPTFIVVNPIDPLRDEGINLARDLADCGVEVQLHMWEGTFHGSLGYPVDSWHEMNQAIARFIKKHGA